MTIAIGKTVAPNLIKVPFRDIHITEDKVIDRIDFLNFITQLASVLPRYQEGSFTASFGDSGGTFATATLEYRIVGYLCFVTNPGGSTISGTSTGTNFTITGAPAVIAPFNAQSVSPVAFEDNTSLTISGRINIPAGGGTWTCRSNFGSGAWTGSGTKGMAPQTFCFPLS